MSGYARSALSSQFVNISIVEYDTFGNGLQFEVSNTVSLTPNVWALVTMTFTVSESTYFVAPNMFALNPSPGSAWTSNITWGSMVLVPIGTPEWAPMSIDNRMHVMMSAYTMCDLGVSPTATTPVTPFSEFYDDWGNYIGRAISRSFSNDYFFDSFGTGYLQPLSVRSLDVGGQWIVSEGSFTVTPAMDIRATTASTESIAVIGVPATGIQALTYTNGATSGLASGLVFWAVDNNNFWYAGETALYYRLTGTMHHGATYSGTTLSPGDRVYVYTNNTTATTVIPGTATNIVGPSIVVYKNHIASANILVAMSASPAGGQIAFPSPTPPKPSTTPGTTSFAGIIAEAPTA
jgi:hypothetical protein